MGTLWQVVAMSVRFRVAMVCVTEPYFKKSRFGALDSVEIEDCRLGGLHCWR